MRKAPFLLSFLAEKRKGNDAKAPSAYTRTCSTSLIRFFELLKNLDWRERNAKLARLQGLQEGQEY